MTAWTAVVITVPELKDGPMVSRLPSYLHPVAGRPLLWHTINSLALRDLPPTEVVVVGADLTADLFDGLPVPIRLQTDPASVDLHPAAGDGAGRFVAIHASAPLEAGMLRRLLDAESGAWLGDGEGPVVALTLAPDQVAERLAGPEPLARAEDSGRKLSTDPGSSFIVRTRADLSAINRRIRDQLVRALMEAGVTFLLPDSVIVDVDVRIGRDTVVYPGVALEGQTTVGEETVIGPGCRIIDSWIGSGVELKGWNYVAHTSVRNRAILEPYVRRGFD